MVSRDLHAALHERVADQVLRDFKGLPRGAKLDSMRALAGRYDVSLVTVREALLLLEGSGWLELRHGSGCYVARPLPVDRHTAILVELDILRTNTSPFFLRIVNRLRRMLSDRGQPFRLHIGFATELEHGRGDPTCHGFMEDLENDHVSGVLAVATLPKQQFIMPLRKQGIPIIGMDFPRSGFDATVCLDYGGMLRLGAETLIAQGCRRLAMAGGGYLDPEDAKPLDDFEKAIRQAGLVPHGEWVRTALSPTHRGAGWDDFHEIWGARDEKPDGLFVADNMLLADVDLAIRALKIDVPRELKVVVATSRQFEHRVSFPFVRLENDPEELADRMTGLMFDLMAGRRLADRAPVVRYKVAEGEGVGAMPFESAEAEPGRVP